MNGAVAIPGNVTCQNTLHCADIKSLEYGKSLLKFNVSRNLKEVQDVHKINGVVHKINGVVHIEVFEADRSFH